MGKEQETTGFEGIMVLTLQNNSAVIFPLGWNKEIKPTNDLNCDLICWQ